VVLWQTKGSEEEGGSAGKRQWQEPPVQGRDGKQKATNEGNLLISGMGTALKPVPLSTQDLRFSVPSKGLQSTSSTADTWKSVHNKFDNELWNFRQIVTLFGIVGYPYPKCHSWNLFCCHKFWNNNYCHLYLAERILGMEFYLHNKRLSQRKTYFILGIVIIPGKGKVSRMKSERLWKCYAKRLEKYVIVILLLLEVWV